MTDRDEDSANFMRFLQQNAEDIQKTWPVWKAAAYQLDRPEQQPASPFNPAAPDPDIEPPAGE